MKYFSILIISIFFVSCTAQNKSNYSKIQYEAGACFGFCPIFKMTINPDRTAVIDAERFTFYEGGSTDDFSKPKEGVFKTTIKKADFEKLISMLDSIKLKSLKSYYGDKNITDLPTSHLRITFSDGTSKHIEDYGKHGTEDLYQLYQFLEGLRKSQTWTKTQ